MRFQRCVIAFGQCATFDISCEQLASEISVQIRRPVSYGIPVLEFEAGPFRNLIRGQHLSFLPCQYTTVTDQIQKARKKRLSATRAFTDPVCGHGCFDWHCPDKTDSDPATAVQMAQQTWYALKELAEGQKELQMQRMA